MSETFEQFRARVTTPPRLRDSATGRYTKDADPETSQWGSGVDWGEIRRVFERAQEAEALHAAFVRFIEQHTINDDDTFSVSGDVLSLAQADLIRPFQTNTDPGDEVGG